MKLFILFFILSMVLNGCSLFTPENKTSDEVEKKNTEQVIEPGSDAYYMNIAKDLYTAQQYKQAYQISSVLAEKNNVEAQYLLGYLHYYGQGVPVDIKQGSKWISAAADAGYRPAIEALVLIKHGLTPDNKCSSVNLLSENTKAVEQPVINKKADKSLVVSNELKKGEVLITPKTNSIIDNTEKAELSETDKITIELSKTKSEQITLDYAENFKEKNPELKDYVITYKSKDSPYSYGVGFNLFENISDAEIVLKNMQFRLNDTTLFIKNIENYTLLTIDE